MAPLFSKVDSNKLWHDVQNEENVINAQSGKDLFYISKVIGRKTKWPSFLDSRSVDRLIVLSHVCKTTHTKMNQIGNFQFQLLCSPRYF